MTEGYIDVAGMWDAHHHAKTAIMVAIELADGSKLSGQKLLVPRSIATPGNGAIAGTWYHWQLVAGVPDLHAAEQRSRSSLTRRD